MDGVIGVTVVNTFGLPGAERDISGGLIGEFVDATLSSGITDPTVTYLQQRYPAGAVQVAC